MSKQNTSWVVNEINSEKPIYFLTIILNQLRYKTMWYQTLEIIHSRLLCSLKKKKNQRGISE